MLLAESSHSGDCESRQPRGAPGPKRRGGRLFQCAGAPTAVGALGGGVVRERVDGDGDFHALQAESIAADEVVAAGLGERDEVLAGGPVAGDPGHGAVVVPRLVHLEHVVRPLLVPERCTAIVAALAAAFRAAALLSAHLWNGSNVMRQGGSQQGEELLIWRAYR